MSWAYLESFGPVDGSERPQDSEYSEDLHNRDGTGAGEWEVFRAQLGLGPHSGRRGKGRGRSHSLDAEGDEGHTDHKQIQQIEPATAERASVQEGPKHCHLGIR